MKKNLALFLCLLTLAFVTPFSDLAQAFTVTDDVPADEGGNGFGASDPCGYVMGTAAPYNGGFTTTVSFSLVGNNLQGCFDANGYAYADTAFRDSRANLYLETADANYTYTVDFAGVDYQTVVDQTTGYWSGFARITDPSFSGTNAQRWVVFDWTCSTAACTAASAGKYHVKTNLNTGVVSGYAWNDAVGFVSFRGLTQELPPEQVSMYVDILSSDGSTGPEAATPANAPLADGYDYWRVRVQFVDDDLNYLGASDVSALTITPNSSGRIYLNQVENTGDAVLESTNGAMVKDPSTGTYAECSTTGYCLLTEENGFTSWNLFVRSSSPTSNMLGLQNDTDDAVDYFGDRDGCRWVYYDQWYRLDGAGSQTACPGVSSGTYYKEDYFSERVSDRNQYILESLSLDVTFANPRSVLTTNSYLTEVDSDSYLYMVHDTAGDDGLELSFRPRFQVTDFTAVYNDGEHDQLSEDIDESMELSVDATVSNVSDAFFAALGLRRPGYAVKYQLDTDSDLPLQDSETTLLMDSASDADTIPDCTVRTDTVNKSYTSTSYSADYTLRYGQRDSKTCGGDLSVPPQNQVSAPTAEQWVCDRLKGDVPGQSSSLSCYYTAYLPRIDRHLDPESMLVIGAINSTIGQDDFFSNDETLSILGATETIKLRNKMYAQIVRYTLGQNASSSQGHLNGFMLDANNNLLSLLGGRLLYGEGGIIVDGSSAFSDKTIVTVGGNVIIRGNVTGGRLGIIAFADSDGNGGNVYIEPDVTDLYANIFVDGAVLPFDGVTVPTNPVEFRWASDEDRMSTLMNQLYLNGSIVSRNTVNGAPADSFVAGGSWPMGDGTTTSVYYDAREHDLNLLRQYRRCYALNDDGTLSSTVEDCGELEQRSTYGEANDLYNSFILDYSPADELPIFRAESGLFQ